MHRTTPIGSRRRLRWLLPAMAGICTLACTNMGTTTTGHASSPQFIDGRFRNAAPPPVEPFGKTAVVMWNFLFHKPAGSVPDRPVAVQPITRAALEDAPDRSLYRLGHSSLLLKLQGRFWLTDPVFSERASPVSFIGPRRFHPPPIALDALPPIAGVIISHDHYDHLDRDTILALAATTGVFLTPLGVGDRLIAWGVPASKVRQLDWWQDIAEEGLTFTATPSQHFSGRSLRDADRTLWASWVVQAPGLRLFFSGDSGYFDGFRKIGERFGPFDATFIEAGAYDAQWPQVHMQPEQSVQAHLDLRGRTMVPIHNGTFDLALHAWREPLERVAAVAAQRGVALSTPRIGERLSLDAPAAGSAWWR